VRPSCQGLEASLAAAAYIRPYIDATLFNTAETRLEQFRHAHEVAQVREPVQDALPSHHAPWPLMTCHVDDVAR
jgi:hypothetical protein